MAASWDRVARKRWRQRLPRPASPIERVRRSRRADGDRRRIERTVAPSDVRESDNDSSGRSRRYLLGSPRRPHGSRHCDCGGPAGHARRAASGQSGPTRCDKVCAAGQLRSGTDGSPGHFDGKRQSHYWSHHAHRRGYGRMSNRRPRWPVRP